MAGVEQVIVLGFDGLGLGLVEEFGLEVVKQKAHTVTVLTDFKTHPFTPIIWASMLTGYKVKKMEKTYTKLQRNSSLYRVARKFLPLSWRARLGRIYDRVHGGENVETTAMKLLMSYLKEHNIPTIFDELEERGVTYWHNHIPGYNGIPHHEENMRVVKKALSGDASSYFKYRRLVWAQHEGRVREFYSALDEGYGFYFFYTNLVDALGHLFYTEKKERFKMAMAVEEVVQTVKDSQPNAVIYVISDHGMTIHDGIPDHSLNGFFSSSTGELIDKPFDLYTLIRRQLL